MTLFLVQNALKMKIPLKVVEKYIEYVLKNWDKIYDRMIMYAKIGRDENVDINNRASSIVQLIRQWIKKSFKLDLVL